MRPRACHEQIRRLQVAVYDVELMGARQRSCGHAQYLHHRLRRWWLFAERSQPPGEIATVDVLVNDKWRLSAIGRADQAHQILAHAAGLQHLIDLDLGLETRQH
jgi:hypothetical protein